MPENIYAIRLYTYNRAKGGKAWFDEIMVEELGTVER
tara:strand:+ start:84 stop:194 length:111 start_codon:yes stop_codon:yes gene_type:complete